MVLAHAGHWALQVLYAFPVLLVVGFIVFDRLRRRAEDEDRPDGEVAADERRPGADG